MHNIFSRMVFEEAGNFTDGINGAMRGIESSPELKRGDATWKSQEKIAAFNVSFRLVVVFRCCTGSVKSFLINFSSFLHFFTIFSGGESLFVTW